MYSSLIYYEKILKLWTFSSGYTEGSMDKREGNLPQQSGSLFIHEPKTSRTGHNMRDLSIGTFSRNLP